MSATEYNPDRLYTAREVGELQARASRAESVADSMQHFSDVAERAERKHNDLRARVEALAAEYEADARHEGYGGELWSTTAAALRALLDDPAPEPVTADEVAEVMDQAVNVGPLLVDGRLVTTAQRIATVLLDRFHVTRKGPDAEAT